MPSSQIFQTQFFKLATLFNLSNEEALSGIYYEALVNLPDMRFIQICETAIAECEFMPKPAWFIQRATEMAVNEPLRAKALPYAEPEDGVSSCPAHVRKWMQLQAPINAELAKALVEARRRETARQLGIHRVQTGKRLDAPTALMIATVERASSVVTTKQAIDNHRGNPASALAEMQMLAATMTAEEISEFTYEWSVEEVDISESF